MSVSKDSKRPAKPTPARTRPPTRGCASALTHPHGSSPTSSTGATNPPPPAYQNPPSYGADTANNASHSHGGPVPASETLSAFDIEEGPAPVRRESKVVATICVLVGFGIVVFVIGLIIWSGVDEIISRKRIEKDEANYSSYYYSYPTGLREG